jgi:hypothetical protein
MTFTEDYRKFFLLIIPFSSSSGSSSSSSSSNNSNNKNSNNKGTVAPVRITKAYSGSRGIAPLILNLGTRWWCVVNFMPPAAIPPEGTQALIEKAGRYSEPVSMSLTREKSVVPAGNRTAYRAACSLVFYGLRSPDLNNNSNNNNFSFGATDPSGPGPPHSRDF